MKKTPILLLLLLFLFGCKKSDSEFVSPKNIFVDYISSYTGGVISVGSEIRLQLAKSLSDSLSNDQLDEIFDFSPSIEGNTFLTGNTLVFKPTKQLPYDQKYQATVNLGAIIPNIDDDKEEFRFIFQTFIQNFEVDVRGVKYYDDKDLSKVKVYGFLYTADIADREKLQEVIEAEQSGKDLKVTIDPERTDNAYSFSIENVSRTESAEPVEIEIDGDAIGVDKEESYKVKIPKPGDFSVMSADIIRKSDTYISVLMSEPIDPDQNLIGLVSLTNTSKSPRIVVDLNEIKVYPTSQPTESFNIVISPGVKNISGKRLPEIYRKNLTFLQEKPAVKLVNESDKSIIPNSKNLTLPFEAIGLKAVEVTIVRVFEDNMIQYLQVNSLGGTRELNRVARPVARKVIPLTSSGVTNLNKWNSFSLNLEDIFNAEPGAFYQINIGFQKAHSLYYCAGEDNIEAIDNIEENWNETEESSYWDSYEYYYSPDYDWSERDNPCSNSYYGRRRSVNKMLFSSDLGLIAKKSDGGKLSVFVTDLNTTEILSGVNIEVYDYQQQLLAKGQTGSEGKVELEMEGTPFVVVAKKNKTTGYLKIDDGSSLSLSNFDVAGNKIQKGLKGFIYGERGVWRPADTVHLGFIIEDKSNNLPENHPVIMELYNPAGQMAFRKISSENVGPMFRFDFVTSQNAPTGNWKAKAKVGGATFEKTVKIETIKPNRLKVNLTFDKEQFTANDKEVTGDLNVKWLTGATAKNLKAEFDIMLRPVKTTFKSFPNFVFDDQSKDFYSSREPIFEGKLNDEGFAKVKVDLGDNDNAPGALNAVFYGKVYEEGGDFSISSTSVPYFPYSSFVGLKAPEGDKRGILLTDENHTIQIASVDAEGNPVSRDELKVTLYKLEWRWWWDNSYESISNYVGSSYNDPISTKTISTSNGKGEYTLRINEPEWGRYYLKVEDPESGHSAGDIIYVDWPGWAGKAKRGDLDGASMLDFTTDKAEYNVGEEVELTLPSTEGNRLLVSLENGSEVIKTFWVETESGQTTVNFEAEESMAPNTYAHLTMIQPHGQKKNDLPIRLYGVQSIKVVNNETILEPVINMPKELRPQEEFSIEVSEKNGKAMAYTIAIVDEGLLDITNFKTPQPWENFYSREALGIKTWDIYDDVLDAFTGKMQHLLAVGGDGELKAKDNKEANRFKPVAKVLGPFYLEDGETTSHKIMMPQYIGSVRTMVIAANSGAYGSSETATPVKQPLMVMATLPRVAGPKETMKLPVNVFALRSNVGAVDIKVETTGSLKVEGNSTKKVSFSKKGDKIIDFDIVASDKPGVGKVHVIATAKGLKAEYDIEMNIIPRNPASISVDGKVLPANESWSSSYSPIGIEGSNTGFIEVSSMPALNIRQRLDYLIKYPHGCIEQTTSSVFAQLYLDNLIDLSEEEKSKIQTNIEAAINRIRTFALANGGFSYWPGGEYANAWGTNYAGHFLLAAKEAGYLVPDDLLQNWISFQKSKGSSWGDLVYDNDHDLSQAYRLYTLALAGEPELGAMNRMKENPDIGLNAKWRLALAYATAGYVDQAKSMINDLRTQIAPITTNKRQYNFGSELRDKAMMLETLTKIGERENAFNLVMDISSEMGDANKWMSTQTTGYSFIAISKYTEGFDIDENVDVEVTVEGKTTSLKNKYFINQIPIENSFKSSKIAVKNNAASPVYVRVIRTGIPVEGKESSKSQNINFKIAYESMNGEKLDPSRLPQGTNFKAIVTVSNPGSKGNYKDLALTQIFPSGWEIINTRLDGSAQSSSKADYMDIRDDRVMHYFDLDVNQSATFEVLLNASYKGRYYQPMVKVEAMYDNSIFANTEGQWVQVIP
ncbi:alpha-2-macroglobulin family protein [Marinigracilibium pacificum]|uniref:Alpha-2-macroglobulin family protein n=1 Tax=Marinigracilibium pacificum TaxID=2729599 RepID=A0A848J3V1_9BACT|nr:MG2 domain-containing protein [Marinigracilibium pacificum]NMM50401.1 hypothetical protein [Marinigracilibium pacificum]